MLALKRNAEHTMIDLSRIRLSMAATGMWLLLTAATLLAGCGGSDDNYTSENEALLGMLPLFPGSTEVSRDSVAYTIGDSGGPDGYTLSVNYRVPPGTQPQEIVDFYLSHLDGWESEVTASDTEPASATFRRRIATIHVGTANVVTQERSFAVAVDARRCERRECLPFESAGSGSP